MTARDAILYSLGSTKTLLNSYLTDFSDADLVVRPVPTANHVAWQLGHMIEVEMRLVRHEVHAVEYPPLPAGFSKQHAAANNRSEEGFLTKEQYLALFNKVRFGTMAATRGLPEDEFDRPSAGPMAQLAPTLGDLLLLVGTHTMMHVGQFTVARRNLGKALLF